MAKLPDAWATTAFNASTTPTQVPQQTTTPDPKEKDDPVSISTEDSLPPPTGYETQDIIDQHEDTGVPVDWYTEPPNAIDLRPTPSEIESQNPSPVTDLTAEGDLVDQILTNVGSAAGTAAAIEAGQNMSNLNLEAAQLHAPVDTTQYDWRATLNTAGFRVAQEDADTHLALNELERDAITRDMRELGLSEQQIQNQLGRIGLEQQSLGLKQAGLDIQDQGINDAIDLITQRMNDVDYDESAMERDLDTLYAQIDRVGLESGELGYQREDLMGLKSIADALQTAHQTLLDTQRAGAETQYDIAGRGIGLEHENLDLEGRQLGLSEEGLGIEGRGLGLAEERLGLQSQGIDISEEDVALELQRLALERETQIAQTDRGRVAARMDAAGRGASFSTGLRQNISDLDASEQLALQDLSIQEQMLGQNIDRFGIARGELDIAGREIGLSEEQLGLQTQGLGLQREGLGIAERGLGLEQEGLDNQYTQEMAMFDSQQAELDAAQDQRFIQYEANLRDLGLQETDLQMQADLLGTDVMGVRDAISRLDTTRMEFQTEIASLSRDLEMNGLTRDEIGLELERLGYDSTDSELALDALDIQREALEDKGVQIDLADAMIVSNLAREMIATLTTATGLNEAEAASAIATTNYNSDVAAWEQYLGEQAAFGEAAAANASYEAMTNALPGALDMVAQFGQIGEGALPAEFLDQLGFDLHNGDGWDGPDPGWQQWAQ